VPTNTKTSAAKRQTTVRRNEHQNFTRGLKISCIETVNYLNSMDCRNAVNAAFSAFTTSLGPEIL